MKNVVLIGMPGSGKSTSGVLAAKALCMDFVDTDLVIQQNEKMPLQAIINTKGNESFAAAEESAVCGLNVRNAVIATGGSVVYSEKAMTHLKENAVVLYLRISFETMMKRIADMHSRGILLKDGETVRAMYDERISLYEKYADKILDCDGKDVETTVSEIVAILAEK
ncbi:MAG: shikimate kinase [Clostridia bacterium]|nr:shikimate kinase [Clostridia bacterium]